MKLFKRENYLSKIRGFYHTNDIIKVITGIRRCGKSSLMQMIADEIIESGVNKENIIYTYARSKSYTVTVGRIGKLECDFILKDKELNYSYVQVAYTIQESKKTEDREYNSLEMIRDNYPKYVVTTDYLLQKRNGIKHINLMEFLRMGSLF